MTAEDNTMQQIDVPTRTHGRVVVEEGLGPALHLVVGFHGYGQNADEMLRELRALPVASPWTTAAVQALHRFYRGRSDVTVASWMTRQDRDLLIADNIAYVDEAVSQVAAGRPIERLVFCGFSQGVAMAFRAATRGRHHADLVVGVGADVPPELLQDRTLDLPPVFLARGTADAFYSADQHAADIDALRDRSTQVDGFVFDGGHEWTDEVRLAVARRLSDLGTVG
jgi:predicted esterase